MSHLEIIRTNRVSLGVCLRAVARMRAWQEEFSVPLQLSSRISELHSFFSPYCSVYWGQLNLVSSANSSFPSACEPAFRASDGLSQTVRSKQSFQTELSSAGFGAISLKSRPCNLWWVLLHFHKVASCTAPSWLPFCRESAERLAYSSLPFNWW